MTDSVFPGKIAVMGGGSWATAQASLLLRNCGSIVWYMRRQDRIDEFRRLGHNPVYLSDVAFDTSRIAFTTDINLACSEADTLLMVMPSPYLKSHLDKITVDLSGKNIVSAIKGMVPDGDTLISRYMVSRFGVSPDRVLVVGGPCHAEEVALGRSSYLTIGCSNPERAALYAAKIRGKALSTVISTDVEGIEIASVLKNIYAIAAGIVHGLKMGDNFLAVLVSNAIREMERFMAVAVPRNREICRSAYLGDLLVTSYSRFSRNHNFGSMIGRGYSVKAARMEMEQTAEGYFGTACIHNVNSRLGVDMPLLETVYAILYEGANAECAVRMLAGRLT